MVKKKVNKKRKKQEIDNFEVIKKMALFAVVIFSGWLFFWPLVECWYAQDISLLLENEFKLISFLAGGAIFWVSDYMIFKEKFFRMNGV